MLMGYPLTEDPSLRGVSDKELAWRNYYADLERQGLEMDQETGEVQRDWRYQPKAAHAPGALYHRNPGHGGPPRIAAKDARGLQEWAQLSEPERARRLDAESDPSALMRGIDYDNLLFRLRQYQESQENLRQEGGRDVY